MLTHSNKTLRYTLLCSASAIAITSTAATVSAQENDEGGLEEIIVTARKRAENIQDVPSSVQALTDEFLKDAGAQGMADYGRFIPSMTVQTTGGSSGSQVYFRGITDSGTNYIGSASASIYLNETSVTMVGDSPNLRMIDINRVEALAGPQGTLYGASAQSGTLRVYTNQPNTQEFEASVDMTFKTGAKSDFSRDIIGVINVPIVQDKFAIRIAVNEGKDGGYIDNVFAHTPNVLHGWNNLPSESGTLTNSHVVEDNYNKTDFSTVVASARWEINEDWAATGSYRFSENISTGSDFYNPFVGDLEVVQFNPSHREEKWDIGSLVIEGDLGWAQVVSSTSFYSRDTYYDIDATAYMKYYANWACSPRPGDSERYWHFPDPSSGVAIYYAKYCMGATADDDWTGTVTGPASQDRFSQEVRMSHQGEDVDWLLGLYYEDANDNWDNNWMVPGHGSQLYPDSLAATYWRESGFVDDYSWHNVPACPECIPLVDEGIGGLYSRDRTNFQQKAIFGEFTWHATEQLDVIIGGRYFERDVDKHYIQYHVTTGTNREPDGIMLKHGYRDGQKGGEHHIGKDKKFVPKVTVKYTIDEDKMVYATYTQGFRPGGVNRGRNDFSDGEGNCVDSSRTATDADGNSVPGCTLFPQRFDPDTVTNYEIGSRMQFGGNVQFNATAFYMKWDDYQLELLEPSKSKCNEGDALPAPHCGQPWAMVVANIGGAHTMGLQLEGLWVVNENFDVGGNLTWTEAEVDDDFTEAGNSRGPSSFGAIIKGQRLPSVPKIKASAWANYSMETAWGDMTLRGQYSYVGESFSDLVPTEGDVAAPNLKQEAYGIADLNVGLKLKDNENVEIRFFVNNITDTRGQVAHRPEMFGWLVGNDAEYERMDRIYTNRPREFGMRLLYRFGGN